MDGAGYYFAPTLLAGAKQEDAIVQREVFGPVVSVTVFDDEDRCWRGQMIRNTDWHLPSGPGMLGVRIALALACNMVAPGQYPFHAG